MCRVVKYVVPIVSQVKGRVIEVPVANNQAVKKGDVLFRVDPTPYASEVAALEAQLVSDEARVFSERAKVGEVQTRLPDAEAGERQLGEQLKQATNQIATLQASLELARRRVTQNTELAAAGAGNRFDLEQAQTNVVELTSQIAAARNAEQEIREKLSGRINGDLASIAGVKAQITTANAQIRIAQAQMEATRAKLQNARWDLEQTTVVAPGNGTMVNVMLRPGYFVSGVAFNEVMTFVDNEYQVFALFSQNELHQVEPGQRSGDHARHLPGPHRQGPCGFGDLGAGAGTGRRIGQSADDHRRRASRAVPGEARRGRKGQRALCRCRRARLRRHLHGTRRADSPDSKSVASDGVVSRLHHHQAPHQPALRHRPWPARTSRFDAGFAPLLAARRAVVATMVSGCALKAPPETAVIKEQALPGAAGARAVGRGAASREWARWSRAGCSRSTTIS